MQNIMSPSYIPSALHAHRDGGRPYYWHWSLREYNFLLHDGNHVPLRLSCSRCVSLASIHIILAGVMTICLLAGTLDDTERFRERNDLAFK